MVSMALHFMLELNILFRKSAQYKLQKINDSCLGHLFSLSFVGIKRKRILLLIIVLY